MNQPSPRKGPAWLGLLLALGAGAAVVFVLAEPIAAYERLQSGVYSMNPVERAAATRQRMNEAGLPLITATVTALLASALCLLGRRSLVGKLGILIGLGVLATSGYVWVQYGDQIVDAL